MNPKIPQWAKKLISSKDGVICVVRCMDYRLSNLSELVGCYEIANAGPRLSDSLRSIKYFLKLTDEKPCLLVWLTHSGACGCSKIETELSSLEEIDSYSISSGKAEYSKLLQDENIRLAIQSGKLNTVFGSLEISKANPKPQLVLIP